MNLPTYSLIDAPHPTILNVCLGVPPSSRPIVYRAPPAPVPSSSSQTTWPDRKGNKAAAQQHQGGDDEEDEEQWQDAEFRLPSMSQNNRKNPPGGLPSNPEDQDLKAHPLLSFPGWDEHFATANAEGWAIYRTYPLRVLDKQVVPNGSLRIVMPLHRTNLVYLVGGPPSALWAANKVVIYDAGVGSAVMTIELSSAVLGLAGRRDKLVVVLRTRVVVFAVSESEGVREEGAWETCPNPNGLVALASAPGSSLLVFPGRQPGKIQVVHLPAFQPDRPPPPAPAPPPDPPQSQTGSPHPPYPSTAILVAHTSALACLATTPCGRLIASASLTGTLIRIWNPRSGALVRELRRGSDPAHIWAIRFRPDGLAICATSDKGTIHVWSLADKPHKAKKEAHEDGKTGRPLALLKPYLPKYFHSTWSDAFFRLPGPGGGVGWGSGLGGSSSSSGSKGVRGGGAGALPGIFSGGSGTGGSEEAAMRRPTSVEEDVSVLGWILAAGPGPAASLEPQIVAATRSGAWFRLRVPSPPSPSTIPAPSPSTTSTHTLPDRAEQLECLEYRRLDDNEHWSDDEPDNLPD
ncbi:hypothetical protein PCASD_24495 [Puccinia coronata f. sp. avenae]|nr:hypothetical protein PCASD_24495 [Puccinia coronata f. sp. avenae]